MQGYIKRLERLAPEDQEVEVEEQIERTYENIVQDPGFRDVMVGTNVWNWAIDQCNILAMDIGDGEVRAKLSYLASGEYEDNADKPLLGNKIRGEALAVVDDNGDVRYETVTAELVLDSDLEQNVVDGLQGVSHETPHLLSPDAGHGQPPLTTSPNTTPEPGF